MQLHDSTDRRAGAFILFGLGFAGFWTGACGIIIGKPLLAMFGALLLLLVFSVFYLGSLLDPH